MEVDEWEVHIERERTEKDQFFAGHWQSPIPSQDRASFKKLDYYPPDPNYRFEIELHEHDEKKIVRMAYTKGDEQDFPMGRIPLKIGDEECVLQAYASDPEEERLFVPSKDATSDLETYGAGRYLDLDAGWDRTAEGTWILDFNKAYNPWCVYSEDYTCPFVPPENWLKVPIRAGEKNYPLKR